MLHAFTFVILIIVGVYFIALGVTSLFAPAKAKIFLLGFAGSPFKHYLELALRLIVGGSILVQAPHLIYPGAFTLFGWILIVTTVCLLFVPWKWHRRFAEKAVPIAVGYLPVIGVASLALGSGLLFCLMQASLAGTVTISGKDSIDMPVGTLIVF